MIRLTLFLEYFPYFPLLSTVKPPIKIVKALEVSLDHLIALLDPKLDKNIVAIPICSQKPNSEDKGHIFTIAHVFARSIYE